MAIITLTSDWGLSDYYLAAVKGTIYTQLPEAIIVDISHNIKHFDIEGAAFTIRNCYENFPKGTIHIIGINSEESVDIPHIAVEANGHFFIGADSGIFSMILGKKPDQMYHLDIPADTGYFTFSTRDRFVKAAVHIAKGLAVSQLGDPYEQLNSKLLFQPTTDSRSIKGLVVYIDAYENLITNISERLFRTEQRGRNFEIAFSIYKIKQIKTSYLDVAVPSALALFGSHGFLEIAINQGNAASLLGMDRNSPVQVNFL
ncbi:MAG: SAM hydrolase/SAM-dependent halogenase family protein [Bacteroidales bacterium]